MRLPSQGLRTEIWFLAAALAAVVLTAGAPGEARALEQRVRLIMVDDPACRYCRRWNEAVGVGYANSPEGRIAPLKRVRRAAPELEGLDHVVYTPTFIVMQGAAEVGRISGYSGPGYFYEDLREIFARAGIDAATP